MTTFRSEDVVVGLIALFAALWVIGMLRRAVRNGAFVFPRWRVGRADDPVRFRALLAAYGVALVLMGLISADLLLGLDLKSLA